MVMAAQRGQVAFAGKSALVVSEGVVQVAAHRGPSAARRGAPGVPGPDQMLELPAGPVSGLSVRMVAASAAHWGQLDTRLADPLARVRIRSGSGSGVAGARWWVASRGAAVGGGGAVGVQNCGTPAAAWVTGGRSG